MALALAATVLTLSGASLLVYWRVHRHHAAGPAGAADLASLAFTSPSSDAPKVNKSNVSRVNPYAVVRHGICVPSNVANQTEESRKKWEALLRDPLWQSIFSGVNPEEYQLIKTSLPLQRYVTYWKLKDGKTIHWTGKKLLIPAGTAAFTDKQGDMYLCACGNQVAAVIPPAKAGTILPPGEEPPAAYLVPPEPEPYPEIGLGVPSEMLTSMAPPESATSPSFYESQAVPPNSPFGPSGGGGGR